MSSTIKTVDTSHQTDMQMPRQKLSYNQKNDKWRKANVEAGINRVGLFSNVRRSDRDQKVRNYALLNGKITKEDLQYAINPLGIDMSNMTFPATLQPYDVWSPIFQELFGEDARRPFSYVVRAINEDAISEKEAGLQKMVMQKLTEIITGADKDIQESLTALDKSSQSYQDMRESIATKILNFLRRNLNVDMIFQKGWEDALVASEEIYVVEEISNEPTMRRVNPLEIEFILPHNSDLIDDAEIIVESTYMSVSQIVDTFYEVLSSAEIAALESDSSTGSTNHQSAADVLIFEKGIIPDFASEGAGVFDSVGNIRVSKVTWKSKKKVGTLRFIDPETGEQEERPVSEFYQPVEGEQVDWTWVNEYWEGYKIGEDMFKYMRPKKLQFRHEDNKSICKSGYVGAVYNCNNAQAVSLMDRLLPFIHLYIIIFYNTELAIATNMGKIALIDLSLIPDGWEIEKWLHYARTMKIGFVDSYTQGKEGERKGTLNQSQQNRELNLETGNYIQQHIQLLEFVENKIKDLSGVPRQRLGDNMASDLVGNNQQALVQSSYVTEKWFQVHNFNKKRVLDCLIETAKSCWKDKPKKLQYVTDELATVFFSVDNNEFVNTEFGVFVSNAAKDQEALTTIKQLMQAALQNDKASLSTIIDVLNSESIADTKAKLVKYENDIHEREQKMAETANAPILQAEQMRVDLELEKMDREDANLDKQLENNIVIAEIKAMSQAAIGQADADLDDNGTPDILELEKLRQKTGVDREKLNLERKKLVVDQVENSKQRQHEKDLKKKDEVVKRAEMAAKIKVAKIKPKPKPAAKKK